MRTYAQFNPVDPVDRPTWVDAIENPYLHGPYTPVVSEVTAVDLEVIHGEIPADLYGAYMRNGPNPLFKPISYTYPMDGDGMIHAVYLDNGRARLRQVEVASRSGRSAAIGKGLKPADQVVVYPPQYKTGDLLYPFDKTAK